MFRKEAYEKLPKHKNWDCEIPIEERKKPTYGPISTLSKTELKALWEYLNKNLKKGFLHLSMLPAGYPILFVLKKDKKLQQYVNYQQLNAIVVKYQYPLSLISELQDRIQGSQWFTALDIRGAFNLVRIKEGEKWKITFRTKYKHYKYTIMQFEPTNTLVTFQALINTTHCKYLNIFITTYFNNILIYTKKTLKEHV